MPDCPHCGFPADPAAAEDCPKCSEPLRGVVLRGLYEVDIVHHGETWEEARAKLLHALDHAILHGHKGLKVIHGHGSRTGRARIASYARGFLKSHARRSGARLVFDKGNPGASILWMN